jgi:hypothetical protein
MASERQESAGFFIREAIANAQAGIDCWARAQQSLRSGLEHYKTRLDGYKADPVIAQVISTVADVVNNETERLWRHITVLEELMQHGQIAIGKLQGEQHVVPSSASHGQIPPGNLIRTCPSLGHSRQSVSLQPTQHLLPKALSSPSTEKRKASYGLDKPSRDK